MGRARVVRAGEVADVAAGPELQRVPSTGLHYAVHEPVVHVHLLEQPGEAESLPVARRRGKAGEFFVLQLGEVRDLGDPDRAR